MIQREKRYVEVDVRFSTEGRLRPLQIIFDKGQVYKIDKIKDICRRAADVGGVGDRYPDSRRFGGVQQYQRIVYGSGRKHR